MSSKYTMLSDERGTEFHVRHDFTEGDRSGTITTSITRLGDNILLVSQSPLNYHRIEIPLHMMAQALDTLRQQAEATDELKVGDWAVCSADSAWPGKAVKVQEIQHGSDSVKVQLGSSFGWFDRRELTPIPAPLYKVGQIRFGYDIGGGADLRIKHCRYSGGRWEYYAGSLWHGEESLHSPESATDTQQPAPVEPLAVGDRVEVPQVDSIAPPGGTPGTVVEINDGETFVQVDGFEGARYYPASQLRKLPAAEQPADTRTI